MSTVTSLTHPDVRVKLSREKYAGVRKRILYHLVGRHSGIPFLVHNADVGTTLRALMERVYYVSSSNGHTTPPKPVPGVFSELQTFEALLSAKVRGVQPLTYAGFVDTYTGRKRGLYQRAVDSLMTKPLTRKDAVLSSFVKCEKISLRDKPDPAPRIIQPRKPRYNASVGRYLKPFESRMVKAVTSIFGYPTIMKGYSAEQVGKIISSKWSHYPNPVALGFDAKRFDQHVSRDALEWEHRVYNGAFRNRELARQLRWQIGDTGVCRCDDGVIKYARSAGRASGDINTGMGNCLISCAIIYEFLRVFHIDAQLVNNGDDCVLIFDRSELTFIERFLGAWWARFGFNVIVEPPVFVLEEIVFCQMQPVYDGRGYTMVRQPVCLSKDAVTTTDISTRAAHDKWVSAVGMAGVALNGGIPVHQDYYQSMILSTDVGNIQLSDSFQVGGLRWWGKGMDRHYSAPTPEARHSYYLAFGILPEAQVHMERYYLAHPPSYTNPRPREFHCIPPAILHGPL